jgi:hypothetical protein
MGGSLRFFERFAELSAAIAYLEKAIPGKVVVRVA